MGFLVTARALIAAACGAPEPTQTPIPTATPMPTAAPTTTPWTLSSQEAAAIDNGINSVIDTIKTRICDDAYSYSYANGLTTTRGDRGTRRHSI